MGVGADTERPRWRWLPEAELREIVNSDSTVQHKTMKLAQLGVNEVSTVEELTTAMTDTDIDHAVTATRCTFKSSRRGEVDARGMLEASETACDDTHKFNPTGTTKVVTRVLCTVAGLQYGRLYMGEGERRDW